MDAGFGDGEGGSIHGRVEKVSEDERLNKVGNNTRCCVGQVGGYFLFGCLRLSLTHTNNNYDKMAPVWYCTVGYCTVYIHERSKYHKIQKKAGKLMMMMMMRGWLSMQRGVKTWVSLK